MLFLYSTIDYLLSALRRSCPTRLLNSILLITLVFGVLLSYSCGPKKSEDTSVEAPDTTYKLARKKARDDSGVKMEEQEPGTYEEFPVLKASEILPEELLKSEFHQVKEDVKSDCIWNSYTIESEFGEFDAYNNNVLEVRVKEIQAIAKLKETSGAEAMATGAAASVITPFTSAINIATNPVGTVVGVPGGVVTFFKKIYYTGERTVKVTGQTVQNVGGAVAGSGDAEGEEGEDSYSGLTGDVSYLIDWYLGMSGGERRIAKRLGVDPYTSNPVLAAELKRVAKYERIGRLGFGYADLPSVPGAGYVKDLDHYVWDKDPRELRDYNFNSLTEMGIDEELSEEFLNSPFYSPSFQTAIVFALQEMDGVTNREEIIEDAVVAETIPQARLYTEIVLLLAWYHSSQTPFQEIINHSDITSGFTVDRRIITILPLDFLCWSEQVAEVANFHNKVLSDIEAEQREFWFVGRVSDHTKEEITDLGWVVRDGVQIDPSDSESGGKDRATQEINNQIYKSFEREEVEAQNQD